MKKISLLCAILFGCAAIANAQDYNRVAISYEHPTLSFNKDASMWDDKSESVGTNGFGINYIHGFSIAKNMFIETGGNFNFNFGSKSDKWTEEDYWSEDKTKFQNINLQVPVNYVYRFNVAENISIDPYVGLNFKLNLVSKFKNEYSDSDGDNDSSDWYNCFSSDEKDMGHKDATWNRFQMGWHIGVGCNYQRYYLGIQFGTDFIPAYSHKFDGGDKPKINTSDLKISVGYTF